MTFSGIRFVCVALCLGVMLFPGPSSAAQFSTTDLQGIWHLYVLDDLPSSNESHWTRGTLTVNAGGSITGGSVVGSDGSSSTLSGGSLSITSSGIVSGTVDIVGEEFNDLSLSQFKMDRDKSIIVGVDTDFEGFLSFIALIKGGGSFATSDLQGTWNLYGFDDLPSSNDPDWTRGTLTVNASGSITGGSLVSSDGSSSTLSGGSLSITSSGIVSGTIDIAGEGSESISQFKMDRDKNMIVGVDTGVDGFVSIFALIKGGGSFATSDLQGTWHLYVLDDRPSSIGPGGNEPGWTRGTLTVNAGGSITGGSVVSSDGSSFTLSGGSLSITSSGIVSGTVDIVGADSEPISQLKMDRDKSMIVGVGTAADGFVSIIALIKGGSTRPEAMPWLMLLRD